MSILHLFLNKGDYFKMQNCLDSHCDYYSSTNDTVYIVPFSTRFLTKRLKKTYRNTFKPRPTTTTIETSFNVNFISKNYHYNFESCSFIGISFIENALFYSKSGSGGVGQFCNQLQENWCLFIKD